MTRIWNFSAGPAVLPLVVLEQVRDELLDWHGRGMSIIEVSHRGKDFTAVIQEAEADLRELLSIPPNYRVLFLHGGASAQFAMVPINLLRGGTRADYLTTGSWSQKAAEEASRFCQVNIAADTGSGSEQEVRFTRVPRAEELKLADDAAFTHLCTNETIQGVEWLDLPPAITDRAAPLVADMSSHILSRPMDVSRYGVIYAGAQKNIGPAGVTLVIVRDDLIGQPMPGMPRMYDYRVHAENDSMVNTPCTFAIYVAGLVFKWLKRLGGLSAIEAHNIAKAECLYRTIDESAFYINRVEPEARSRMNVSFFLADPALDAVFIDEAQAAGISFIKGHKSFGGMRASMYNAMPLEGAHALAEFMRDFERKHG